MKHNFSNIETDSDFETVLGLTSINVNVLQNICSFISQDIFCFELCQVSSLNSMLLEKYVQDYGFYSQDIIVLQ